MKIARVLLVLLALEMLVKLAGIVIIKRLSDRAEKFSQLNGKVAELGEVVGLSSLMLKDREYRRVDIERIYDIASGLLLAIDEWHDEYIERRDRAP